MKSKRNFDEKQRVGIEKLDETYTLISGNTPRVNNNLFLYKVYHLNKINVKDNYRTIEHERLSNGGMDNLIGRLAWLAV